MEAYLNHFLTSVPKVIGALLLLICAVVLAFVLKHFTIRTLKKMRFDQRVLKWDLAKDSTEAIAYIETFGSIMYFIVFLIFLPGILDGLNIGGIMTPLIQAVMGFLSYVPNVIIAMVILIVGVYFCNFIRKLVKNLLSGLNIDTWYRKVTHVSEPFGSGDHHIAEVVSTIVYAFIFIPILSISLKTLNIPTISVPIIGVLNQVMKAIPEVVASVVLLIIGSFIAKLVATLIESLVATTGIDRLSQYLSFRDHASGIKLSNIIAVLVRSILLTFFVVEAIDILDLSVLSRIGASIISYIPFVVSGIIILGVFLISGNMLAKFTARASGDKVFGEIVRYLIFSLGIFMILEQLQIAQTIVNAGFIIIMSTIGITFAIAFGFGGRKFAENQLEKLEQLMSENSKSKKD